MAYICIGKIINTHGIKGEVKIESYSDFDEERYTKGKQVYICVDEKYLPVTVASYRKHKVFPLVSFVDLQNINFVEQYKGCEIYIDEADRLIVVDEEGITLGKIISVEETLGAQNNLRLQLEDAKEVLIPYIPMIVKNVDLEKKVMTIHRMGGLL